MYQKLFFASVDINGTDAGTIHIGAPSHEEAVKILKEAVQTGVGLPDNITYFGKLCELKTPYRGGEDDKRPVAVFGDTTGLYWQIPQFEIHYTEYSNYDPTYSAQHFEKVSVVDIENARDIFWAQHPQSEDIEAEYYKINSIKQVSGIEETPIEINDVKLWDRVFIKMPLDYDLRDINELLFEIKKNENFNDTELNKKFGYLEELARICEHYDSVLITAIEQDNITVATPQKTLIQIPKENNFLDIGLDISFIPKSFHAENDVQKNERKSYQATQKLNSETPAFRGNFNITIKGAEIQNLLFLDEKEVESVSANIGYWKEDVTAPATMKNVKIGVSNLSFLKKSGEQSDAIPYHWCMDIQKQIKDIIAGNIHYLIQKKQSSISLHASELGVPQVSNETYLLKPKNEGYHTTDEGNVVLNEKPSLRSSFISEFLKDNSEHQILQPK